MTRRRRLRRRLLWAGVLLGLLLVVATVSVLRVGIGAGDALTTTVVAKHVTQPAPDWFERFAAAHSLRDPVRDDRFRIDPTDTASPITVSSSRELEWPQLGVALGLVLALGAFTLIAMRQLQARPPVAP